MTTTSPPARRAAGALNCSDALGAGRPARRWRELVWTLEIGGSTSRKMLRQRIGPRRPRVTGDISETMVGIGHGPAHGDRMTNRAAWGAYAPGYDRRFWRLIFYFVAVFFRRSAESSHRTLSDV